MAVTTTSVCLFCWPSHPAKYHKNYYWHFLEFSSRATYILRTNVQSQRTQFLQKSLLQKILANCWPKYHAIIVCVTLQCKEQYNHYTESSSPFKIYKYVSCYWLSSCHETTITEHLIPGPRIKYPWHLNFGSEIATQLCKKK